MNKITSRSKTLLLEDEPLIVLELESVMNTLGFYDLTICGSVKEAEQLCDSHTFELAILDVNLNGEMSFDLAKRLVGGGSEVYLTSGYEIDRSWLEENCIGFIPKPYDKEMIKAALTAASTSSSVATAGPSAR